jgi:hypothetical protein
MNDLNTDIKKSNEKFEDLLNKKYINKIEKNEKYKDLFILLNKKEEDNKKKNNNSNIIFNSNLQKCFKNNKYNKFQYKIRNIDLDRISSKDKFDNPNNQKLLVNKKLYNIYKNFENNNKTKKIDIILPSSNRRSKQINKYIFKRNSYRNKNNLNNNNISEKVSFRNTFSTDNKTPKKLLFDKYPSFNLNSEPNLIKKEKINDWIKNEKKNQKNNFYKNKQEEINSLLNTKNKYNLNNFNEIQFNSEINPNILIDIQNYNKFFNNEIRKFSNKLNKTNQNQKNSKKHKKSNSLIGNYFINN